MHRIPVPPRASGQQTNLSSSKRGGKEKKKAAGRLHKVHRQMWPANPKLVFFFFADKKEFDARAALAQRHGFVELDQPWAGSFEM